MHPIDRAFAQTPRAQFMPPEVAKRADSDLPQPIGYGQTISQPSLVWQMLAWLNVQPGDKILDIGSGSGWTSALLSRLTGSSGQVLASELIPELVEFGKQNCQRLGLTNVSFYQAGDIIGLPDKAPFDRILVSASANELPNELLDQLAPGGCLVIPIKNDILIINKQADGTLSTKRHHGFQFVPLLPQ